MFNVIMFENHCDKIHPFLTYMHLKKNHFNQNLFQNFKLFFIRLSKFSAIHSMLCWLN